MKKIQNDALRLGREENGENRPNHALESMEGRSPRSSSKLRQSKANAEKRRTKGSGCIFEREEGGKTLYGGYLTRNGQREYVEGLHRTKKEVEKLLAKLKKEPPKAKCSDRLANYIRYLLENDYNNPAVCSSGSWVLTETNLRTHIEGSKLGQKRIAMIIKPDVQDFVNDLSDKGLAPSTVRRIGAIVSKALSMALDAELVSANPAFRVKYPQIPETDKKTLTIEESAHFTDLVKSPRLKAMFRLKIETGMRQQEVCGLHWEYIDEDNLCLRLKTALTDATGVLEEKELKEKRKSKGVPISKDLLELLLEQPRRSQFVFTTDSGMPVAMDNFKRDLRQLKQRAKKKGIDLEGLTLHGLRASYATNQTHLGTDIKTVSEILGHHKASYTLDKYVKTNEATKRAAQDRLMDKLMEAKAKPAPWSSQGAGQVQNPSTSMVGGTGIEPVTPTVSL